MLARSSSQTPRYSPQASHGAGPRTMLEGNAHRADEKLKIDDLVLATNVVTLALYDMLTGNA
ncbi:hypothetical protein GCM10023067_56660 [Aminobacter aganoensis]